MAVKMRLRREGKKKQPFYRIVVADVRSPRDGGFIEDVGYYQPLHDPSTIQLDHERALYWLRNGVQPSDAVRNLLRIEGVWEQFKPGDRGRDRPAKRKAVAAAEAKRAEGSDPGPAKTAPEPVPTTPAAPSEGPAADAEGSQPSQEVAEQAAQEVSQP